MFLFPMGIDSCRFKSLFKCASKHGEKEMPLQSSHLRLCILNEGRGTSSDAKTPGKDRNDENSLHRRPLWTSGAHEALFRRKSRQWQNVLYSGRSFVVHIVKVIVVVSEA